MALVGELIPEKMGKGRHITQMKHNDTFKNTTKYIRAIYTFYHHNKWVIVTITPYELTMSNCPHNPLVILHAFRGSVVGCPNSSRKNTVQGPFSTMD